MKKKGSFASERHLRAISKTYKLMKYVLAELHRWWEIGVHGKRISSEIKKLSGKKYSFEEFKIYHEEIEKFFKHISISLSDLIELDLNLLESDIENWINTSLEKTEIINEKIQVFEDQLQSVGNCLHKSKSTKTAMKYWPLVHDLEDTLNLYQVAIQALRLLPTTLNIKLRFCPEFEASDSYRTIIFKGEKLRPFPEAHSKMLKLLHEAHLNDTDQFISKKSLLQKAKGIDHSRWSNAVRSRKKEFENLLEEDSNQSHVRLNLKCTH